MKRSQFEILPVISRTGNLRKTAEIMGKNQSNVSRTVKSLEEELGCKVITYKEKKIILTPEGRMIRECGVDFTNISVRLDNFLASVGSNTENCMDNKTVPYHNWSQKDVTYLTTIRKYGNLSKAAQKLYVSQPSLSQMLKRINEMCSREIFLSADGRFIPGPEGEIFFRYIDELENVLSKIHANLEELYQIRRGTVKVGITANIGISLLPLIVPEFLKRFPDIKLRIRENRSPELKQLMKEGRVDFSILHEMEMDMSDSFLHYPCYFEEDICLVIPKKWEERLALPKDRPLNAWDLLKLADENYVLSAKKALLRDVTERIFLNVREQTGKPYEPVACCSAKNTETIKRLVKARTGITFIPMTELQIHTENSSLISYPLDKSLEAHWIVALALPSKNRLSLCSKEFIDVTANALKNYHPEAFVSMDQ